MKKPLYLLAAVIVLASAACAPAAPTADPAQIQASAVAAAATMVAMTQQAIPSPTEVPPTPLPSPTALPSPTLVALPTLPVSSAPTAAPAPTTSGDKCQAPIASAPDGPMMTVSIANQTNGTVVLSLYLYETTFGECGYWSTVLSPRGSTSAFLPQGDYFAGAFVNDPKAQTKSFGTSLPLKNGEKFRIVVGAETIELR